MNPFPPSLLTPKHWLAWLGVGLLFILVWLPWRTRHWLGKQLGSLMYRRNHKRQHIVLTNLRLCFPGMQAIQQEQLAQEHLQYYVRALLDYSVLFFRPRQWLCQRTRIQGREHIDQAIADGKNVILMLGHSVWLEFAPAVIGQHYRIYGSYKPFRNPVANWLIARSRLKSAEFIVAREEGLMKLVRALEPGLLMVFLPDEDHGAKHSVFAPFFGVRKATLTTAARLCKLGKATALPVMVNFDEASGQYNIAISPPLQNYPVKDEVQDATNLNTALQTLIEQQPAQYMWVLKLFRTRPAEEKPVY